MTREKQETESIADLKARLAADDAEKVAPSLAAFDREVAAPLAAKKEQEQAEQKARQDDLQRQQDEAFKLRQKRAARAAWRGTDAAFEVAWPSMFEKLQVNTVVDSVDVARRNFERHSRARHR